MLPISPGFGRVVMVGLPKYGRLSTLPRVRRPGMLSGVGYMIGTRQDSCVGQLLSASYLGEICQAGGKLPRKLTRLEKSLDIATKNGVCHRDTYRITAFFCWFSSAAPGEVEILGR